MTARFHGAVCSVQVRAPLNKDLFMSAIRVSVILSLSLSACTGGAGGSLVKLKTEQGGVNCTSGGTRIEAGLDANGNGTLEPGEVTDTETGEVRTYHNPAGRFASVADTGAF